MATDEQQAAAAMEVEKTETCHTCDQAFETKAQLQNHVEIHGRHRCTVCEKRFRSGGLLKSHMLEHPLVFRASESSLADFSEAKLFTELAKLVNHESSKSIFAVGGAIEVNELRNGLICDSDVSLEDTKTITTTVVDIDKPESSTVGPGPTELEAKGVTTNIATNSSSISTQVTLPQSGMTETLLTSITAHKPELHEAPPESTFPEASHAVQGILSTVRQAKQSDEIGQNKKQATKAAAKHLMRCDPVTVRWDSTTGTGCKVTFPVADADLPNFEQLLKDCEPATFGRGGESIMDESYRKAGKLDTSAFSTTFDPYSVGIVDAVAHALIPKLSQRTNTTSGLRAELYKLNVYSGPSGRFKAHVDTPRSQHQIGSLVICLPAVHKGGQLVLRHIGREQIFDWSTAKKDSNGKSPSLIHWAAFFSDCEHEVLEVTSGHRVTLTYNLYSTCHANTAALDPEQVGLFDVLKKALAEPAFCKEGKLLGYHCVHAYPHTTKMMFETLPATLKGTDKLLYESLSQLGILVRLRHELEGGVFYDDNAFLSEEDDYYDDGGYHSRPKGDRKGERALISKSLRPLYLKDEMAYEGEGFVGAWDPKHTVERVVWLNRPNLHQPAIMHGTYGNEPDIALAYANLIITVDIPSYKKRSE